METKLDLKEEENILLYLIFDTWPESSRKMNTNVAPFQLDVLIGNHFQRC